MPETKDKKIINLAQIKAAKKFASGHGMTEQEYCAYLDRLKPEHTEAGLRDEDNDSNSHFVFPLLHQPSDDRDNNWAAAFCLIENKYNDLIWEQKFCSINNGINPIVSIVIQHSALLLHSAERMYYLVNDVAAYPEFVDHCEAAEVLESSDSHMVASLTLKKAGVSLSFTTRNELTPPSQITLALEEGPLSKLTGSWQFIELREEACKVSLQLEFVLKNSVTSRLASAVLESVSHSLVDAFCQRADKLYGPNQ